MKPVDTTRHGCSAHLKRNAGTLLIAAVALFPLGGCSLAFVDGPSRAPSPSRNTCTTSYTAPTLDLLGVPTTFLVGFGAGGFERSLEAVAADDDDTFGNLEKASLAASGALLVSGVYGLVQVSRCRGSRRPGGGQHSRRTVLDSRFLGTLPDLRGPVRTRFYTPMGPEFAGTYRSPQQGGSDHHRKRRARAPRLPPP